MTPPLSPAAQLALIAVVGCAVSDLFLRTHERTPGADSVYEAGLVELEAAGLIKRFPANDPIPSPDAYQQVGRLYKADLERLSAQKSKAGAA